MALIRQISRRGMVLRDTDAEVSTAQTIAPHYQWVINGELTYPIETALDALHMNDSAYTMHEVRVSARVAGDSQYRIKIIRRDTDGLNPVVAVDETIVFTSDREVYMLTIDDAEVPQHSSLEVTLFEEIVGVTPARDVTITLIGEDFSELSPIRNGHIIEDGTGADLPQQANLQFTDDFLVTNDNPNNRTVVDLSPLAKNTLQPIGTVVTSLLTEAEYTSIVGPEWALLDGRDITGSDLAALKGWSNLPDFRGDFERMFVNVPDELVDPLAVDLLTDQISVASHKYSTGFRVRLTGTVLGGTAINTDYFVIVVDANTIQLASSYANAQAGTFIDLTSAAGSFTIVQWEDPDASTRFSHESGDLGSLQDDQFRTHSHSITSTVAFGDKSSANTGWSADNGVLGMATLGTSATGGNETRPRNRYVNKFIKINNSV